LKALNVNSCAQEKKKLVEQFPSTWKVTK
jgi:hypothetical protein